MVEAKKSNNVAINDRVWKQKMSDCETNVCNQKVREEAINCINQCTSHTCYDKIYASNPLEDGEIDYDRNRKFTACLREQVNEEKRVSITQSLIHSITDWFLFPRQRKLKEKREKR